MKHVFQIIEDLENEPGRNAKIAILEKYKNDGVLKLFCEYALNPFKVYGIKKIPEYDPLKISARPLVGVLRDLSTLMERKKTGKAAILWLTLQFESLDVHDADLLERVIGKDLRCGVSASTINKVWPGLIPVYPTMLCTGFSEKAIKNIQYPAFVQEKLDGMRVNFVVEGSKVSIYSRNGKPIDLLGLFDEPILKLAGNSYLMFDGELLVLDKKGNYLPRKKGNGIINKAIKGTITAEEAKRIVVVLWDVIYMSDFKAGIAHEGYQIRFNYLESEVNCLNDSRIRLVPSEIVDSFYSAKQYYLDIISKGGEGVIIKNRYVKWENKRSKEQIKMKVESECDLIIMKIVEGEGKHTGKLGAFVCESSDGLVQVNVGSGFSDEQRDLYFTGDMVGQIVAVKYNEVIKAEKAEKSRLFLPIFVEMRADKSEADASTEIK